MDTLTGFVAAMVSILFLGTGAHLWLRFGWEGFEFQLSKDFERAKHEYMSRKFQSRDEELQTQEVEN
jgi:hypothetical protein